MTEQQDFRNGARRSVVMIKDDAVVCVTPITQHRKRNFCVRFSPEEREYSEWTESRESIESRENRERREAVESKERRDRESREHIENRERREAIESKERRDREIRERENIKSRDFRETREQREDRERRYIDTIEKRENRESKDLELEKWVEETRRHYGPSHLSPLKQLAAHQASLSLQSAPLASLETLSSEASNVQCGRRSLLACLPTRKSSVQQDSSMQDNSVYQDSSVQDNSVQDDSVVLTNSHVDQDNSRNRRSMQDNSIPERFGQDSFRQDNSTKDRFKQDNSNMDKFTQDNSMQNVRQYNSPHYKHSQPNSGPDNHDNNTSVFVPRGGSVTTVTSNHDNNSSDSNTNSKHDYNTDTSIQNNSPKRSIAHSSNNTSLYETEGGSFRPDPEERHPVIWEVAETGDRDRKAKSGYNRDHAESGSNARDNNATKHGYAVRDRHSKSGSNDGDNMATHGYVSNSKSGSNDADSRGSHGYIERGKGDREIISTGSSGGQDRGAVASYSDRERDEASYNDRDRAEASYNDRDMKAEARHNDRDRGAEASYSDKSMAFVTGSDDRDRREMLMTDTSTKTNGRQLPNDRHVDPESDGDGHAYHQYNLDQVNSATFSLDPADSAQFSLDPINSAPLNMIPEQGVCDDVSPQNPQLSGTMVGLLSSESSFEGALESDEVPRHTRRRHDSQPCIVNCQGLCEHARARSNGGNYAVVNLPPDPSSDVFLSTLHRRLSLQQETAPPLDTGADLQSPRDSNSPPRSPEEDSTYRRDPDDVLRAHSHEQSHNPNSRPLSFASGSSEFSGTPEEPCPASGAPPPPYSPPSLEDWRLISFDFTPRCIDGGGILTTAVFETFDVLVRRANDWLRRHPSARAKSAETIEHKSNVTSPETLVNTDQATVPDVETAGTLTIKSLRLWVEPKPLYDRHLPPQQLGYINVVPACTDPGGVHRRPQFDSQGVTLAKFNALMRHRPLPGTVMNVETVSLKFRQYSKWVTPDRCHYRQHNDISTSYLAMFRVYYETGEPSRDDIGYRDFRPSWHDHPLEDSSSGGRARRNRGFGDFTQVMAEASRWAINLPPGVRILNMSTLNAKAKMSRDGHVYVSTERAMHTVYASSTLLQCLRIWYLNPPAPPGPQTHREHDARDFRTSDGSLSPGPAMTPGITPGIADELLESTLGAGLIAGVMEVQAQSHGEPSSHGATIPSAHRHHHPIDLDDFAGQLQTPRLTNVMCKEFVPLQSGRGGIFDDVRFEPLSETKIRMKQWLQANRHLSILAVETTKLKLDHSIPLEFQVNQSLFQNRCDSNLSWTYIFRVYLDGLVISIPPPEYHDGHEFFHEGEPKTETEKSNRGCILF